MVLAVLAGEQGVDGDAGRRGAGASAGCTTWITHSITGNSATRAAGITSSHQEPPPTTTRAAIAPTRNVEIMYGDGCRQNERQDPARLRRWYAGSR